MPVIKFHSRRLYNNSSDIFNPSPANKLIPNWFRESNKYYLDNNSEVMLNPEGGPIHAFKSCPALLDTMVSGYMLTTPCDVTFIKNDQGLTEVKTPFGFEDFCGTRIAMPGFPVPSGYSDNHFHFWPNWSPSLPEGYSALYIPPMNRFDLPFICTSGIIDNDKMDTSGLVPFFLLEGFEGTIKSGTPYLQVFPFKREEWNMEVQHYDYDKIVERHNHQADLFRTKDGGEYKKKIWSKKRYK